MSAGRDHARGDIRSGTRPRPTRIEEGDAKTETMSDETAERMARTRFIVDEYTMGVLDEQEAGERLFRHLFPHWG